MRAKTAVSEVPRTGSGVGIPHISRGTPQQVTRGCADRGDAVYPIGIDPAAHHHATARRKGDRRRPKNAADAPEGLPGGRVERLGTSASPFRAQDSVSPDTASDTMPPVWRCATAVPAIVLTKRAVP
jgi:hypothetical protein